MKSGGIQPRNQAPASAKTLSGAAQHENQAGAFDFWALAHRALRGRYTLALVFAVVLGGVGAYFGFSFGQRLFAATGIVRVASALPPVLKETDQNRTIPNFDGFIQAQRDVMGSRETIQAAMQTSEWQGAGASARGLTEAQFSTQLKIESKPRSDHLRITFAHTDPEVAAAGVRSIIAAYREEFSRQQDQFESGRMSQLRERQQALSSQLATVEAELHGVTNGAELAELDLACVVAADSVKKLSGSLSLLQGVIAGGPDVLPRDASNIANPQDMARTAEMQTAMNDLAKAQAQLAQARSRGLSEEHRLVKRLVTLVEDCRKRVASLQGGGEAGAPGVANEDTLASLKGREASLSALVASAEEELRVATARRSKASELHDRALAIEDDLHETNARLDALTVEASSGGRLSVVSGGDAPMTAVLDNRFKYAALGGVLAAAFAFGLLILNGSVARRVRFVVDVSDDLGDRVSFVTALPGPSNLGRFWGEAVHRVHDMRARLQPRTASDRRTLLVSSASSTSDGSDLAMSLALSFVSAGFRTLLVDGDLAAKPLSDRFEAGQCPGLLDATRTGEPLLWKTASGVSFLSAGMVSAGNASRLSPAMTGKVLTALRDRFDVVILVSDSMNSGLDAPSLTPLVDGVLLRVGRGEPLDEVRAAAERVEASGGVLAGVVLENACELDCQPKHAVPASGVEYDIPTSRFGMLTGAMVESLHLHGDEDFVLSAAAMSFEIPGKVQRAA